MLTCQEYLDYAREKYSKPLQRIEDGMKIIYRTAQKSMLSDSVILEIAELDEKGFLHKDQTCFYLTGKMLSKCTYEHGKLIKTVIYYPDGSMYC